MSSFTGVIMVLQAKNDLVNEEFNTTEALVDFLVRIPKLAMDTTVATIFVLQMRFFFAMKMKAMKK